MDVQDKEDADGLFLEKFFLIERFFQMWDGLYRAFLTTWTPALESEIMVWAQSIAPGRQEETPGPLDSN